MFQRFQFLSTRRGLWAAAGLAAGLAVLGLPEQHAGAAFFVPLLFGLAALAGVAKSGTC